MSIVIVGLGPGDSRLITRQVWELLEGLDVLYLRTVRHPAVSGLPKHLSIRSFDTHYENAQSFDDVYNAIVKELLKLGEESARNNEWIVYGVPGHPLVGESTVTRLLAEAKSRDINVEIYPGLSFIEPALSAVGVDGLIGLQLFDAFEIAGRAFPPVSTDLPIMLGQVYSRALASELKLSLMNVYPDDHELFLINDAGLESEKVIRIPLFELDRRDDLAHLTSAYLPPLPGNTSLPAFADTVAVLRGPDGCPWDQEQTRQSLRQGFLEEFAEVLAALDEDDSPALAEELGDLLFHIVIQAQIASEIGDFTLQDVVSGIDEKLKRRHPHVWGDAEVKDSQEVIHNWEKIKGEERGYEHGMKSLLDGVPKSLPALARAQSIQERVSQSGFDWPSIEGVEEKLEEELGELRAADSREEKARELGDVLFVMANLARWLGLDAEVALREANLRFEHRFRRLEKLSEKRGLAIDRLDLDALNHLWNEAKESTGQG